MRIQKTDNIIILSKPAIFAAACLSLRLSLLPLRG
jgi:hypothetical protein